MNGTSSQFCDLPEVRLESGGKLIGWLVGWLASSSRSTVSSGVGRMFRREGCRDRVLPMSIFRRKGGQFGKLECEQRVVTVEKRSRSQDGGVAKRVRIFLALADCRLGE